LWTMPVLGSVKTNPGCGGVVFLFTMSFIAFETDLP
jgi:hypothetical protein